jgi:hypothetical protein
MPIAIILYIDYLKAVKALPTIFVSNESVTVTIRLRAYFR